MEYLRSFGRRQDGSGDGQWPFHSGCEQYGAGDPHHTGLPLLTEALDGPLTGAIVNKELLRQKTKSGGNQTQHPNKINMC